MKHFYDFSSDLKSFEIFKKQLLFVGETKTVCVPFFIVSYNSYFVYLQWVLLPPSAFRQPAARPPNQPQTARSVDILFKNTDLVSFDSFIFFRVWQENEGFII